MQSQNRFISPFRALQKRFYETKPESIHTKHDFVLWKWTRSPSARAGYPVLIPMVWAFAISGYIGFRTLFNHTDVYFDKKKQSLGWDLEADPKPKSYALGPSGDAWRFKAASRLPDSQIEL